jgi:protein phosphatase
VRIRQAVAGTHAGAVRTFNEDAVLRLGRVPLYAIADGMGGPGAGDVAANLSLDVVKRHAMAIRERNQDLARGRTADARRALQKTLEAVANRASRQIREEAARLQQGTMGASLVMVTVADQWAYIAHVGDARAYLVRNGTLQRLTEDHTLAELKLRRGKLSREEYEKHPERHVLYQSLGAPFDLDVDFAEVRLDHGDVLFLCSDGVVSALDDGQIAGQIDVQDLNGSLRNLLKVCIQARCADNVSAVLLGLESDAGTEVIARDEVTAPGAPLPPIPEPEPAPVDVRGSLFAGFHHGERTVLSAYVDEQHLDSGEKVVAEGDPSDRVCVLVNGRANLSVGGIPLGEAAEGVLGEMVFGRDALQSIQAVAKGPVTVLVLTRARFRELLEDHPGLAARVAMGLIDARSQQARQLAARLEAVQRALRGRD